MNKAVERAARELSVPSMELKNSNVKVKIGATEKRDAPTTIYIQISFWTKPKTEQIDLCNLELHKLLEHTINQCYKKTVSPALVQHFYFTRPKDNITIWNIPENLNYNNKRNYISLELYLHTLNTRSDISCDYPLHSKKDRRLYEAAVEIANLFVSCDFFQGQENFEIHKSAS